MVRHDTRVSLQEKGGSELTRLLIIPSSILRDLHEFIWGAP